MLKLSRHAIDRLRQRTNLHEGVITSLDREAERLSDSVAGGHYYLPLRGTAGEHLGYAAFKTVPGRDKPRLVLATILAPHMKPKGFPLTDRMRHPDLAELSKQAEMSPELQAKFDELSQLLRRRGVYAGTGHKRIVIPKTKLTEDDVKSLGFESVLVAIPEAGQDQFRTFRHPDNNFHLHSHPEGWTMHEDRHPAATMIARKATTPGDKVLSYVKGVPHVVTEGLPGLGYYIKGQFGSRESTAKKVLERLRPDVKERINGMSDSYARGKEAAFVKLGLASPSREEEDDHTVRNVAMGAAAASPFAGLIGQNKMIHKDKGELVDYEKLRAMVEPGDVILSGDTHMSQAKGLISAATGTPKGYHVSTVSPGKDVFESHPQHGVSLTDFSGPNERIQVLRPNLTPEQRTGLLNSMDGLATSADGIEDGVRKSLIESGYRKRDSAVLANVARAGLYDGKAGVKAGLKELFMPKLRGNEAIEADKLRAQSGRADLAQNMDVHVKNIAGLTSSRLDDLSSSKLPGFLQGQFKGKDVAAAIPDCAGGVCSTLPATMMPPGKNIVPGKLPSEVMPSDYLRSKMYTPVARYDPKPKGVWHDKLLGHAPWAIRAGVGAGMAAGVYGLSKLWNQKKEAPDVPGAPPTT